jgi:hypothetical protein
MQPNHLSLHLSSKADLKTPRKFKMKSIYNLFLNIITAVLTLIVMVVFMFLPSKK